MLWVGRGGVLGRVFSAGGGVGGATERRARIFCVEECLLKGVGSFGAGLVLTTAWVVLQMIRSGERGWCGRFTWY